MDSELEKAQDFLKRKKNYSAKDMDIELAYRALKVIIGLCIDDIKKDMTMFDTIYKFAHIGEGSCENKHEDWVIELNNTEDFLKKHGVI